MDLNKMETIYVTEFKNQFDVWQVFHAFRNRDKAIEDAGRSGRVIDCVNSSLAMMLQEKVRDLESENLRLRNALIKIRDQDYRGNRPASASIAFQALTDDGHIDVIEKSAYDKAMEEIDRLREALEKIRDHNTLDGNKYNNHTDAYYGIVKFSKDILEESKERIK